MKRGKVKRKKQPAMCHELCATTDPNQCVLNPVVKPLPPFSFKVTVYEQTRLRVGDVIPFGEANTEHVVTMVNPSCARIVPLSSTEKKTVSFKPRFSETEVSFSAPVRSDPIAISANSESPILRRLGRNWKERLSSKELLRSEAS